MKLGTLVRITNVNQAEEKFANLRQHGFSSCQLVYKPDVYTKEDADIVRAAADKHNIEISLGLTTTTIITA